MPSKKPVTKSVKELLDAARTLSEDRARDTSEDAQFLRRATALSIANALDLLDLCGERSEPDYGALQDALAKLRSVGAETGTGKISPPASVDAFFQSLKENPGDPWNLLAERFWPDGETIEEMPVPKPKRQRKSKG